jgi:hypothetical protein
MSPRPITGLVLLFVWRSCSYLTGNTPMGRGLVRGQLHFLCVHVRTSQETPRASSVCYGDRFTLLFLSLVSMSVTLSVEWRFVHGLIPPQWAKFCPTILGLHSHYALRGPSCFMLTVEF